MHCTPSPLSANIRLTAALGGDSYPFSIAEKNFLVTFSALLPGHDDWVFTANFHPTLPDVLLSASADASLIIWRPDALSGIWIPETRLGEVSSLKGATTAQGSSGGFWGGIWAFQGKEVASWGKTGGWRLWSEKDEGLWIQRNAVGGSIRGVKGLSWDDNGRYLLSVRYSISGQLNNVVWIRRHGCLESGSGMALLPGMRLLDLRFMDTI